MESDQTISSPWGQMQNHELAFPKRSYLEMNANVQMKVSPSSACAHAWLLTAPRLPQVYAVASVMNHTHAPSEQPVWFGLLTLLCLQCVHLGGIHLIYIFRYRNRTWISPTASVCPCRCAYYTPEGSCWICYSAVFVLSMLWKRCRGVEMGLNCALKLLLPGQVTQKWSSWEKWDWTVGFSVSQCDQILSHLLSLKLWLASVWLSTSSCTAGNSLKMPKSCSRFSPAL